MTLARRISSGALALSALCMQAQAAEPAPAGASETPALQARISRVERGLSTPIAVKDSPDRRMTLADRMAFHHVPAVSIAVVDNGRMAWARAYGVLDAAGGRPTTTTTLFQAGSISKPVSAIGALRLVDQGALSLDVPANRQLHAWHIPDNAFTRGQAVTLRMLLNHSAGLTVHGFNGYAAGQKTPTLLEVLDGVAPANSAPIRVDTLPGTAWRYSGGGYSVLQLMVAEASRLPFEAYMQQAVLAPLGMTHSTFAPALPPAWRDASATAHGSDGSAVPGRWHVYPESAAAGLWTTPTDLAQVLVAVQQAEAGQPGQLLSRATASEMLTRVLGEYGLGFFVEQVGDVTSFSHGGGTEGFRSRLYGYTRSGKGAVVMTNGANGAALIEEILTSIAAEYGWPEFAVTEKAVAAVEAGTYAKLAGTYQLLDKPAQVIAEGGRLFFQSELFGPHRLELFPESESTYFMTAEAMSLHFERQEGGAASGFSLVRGANTYPGTRQP